MATSVTECAPVRPLPDHPPRPALARATREPLEPVHEHIGGLEGTVRLGKPNLDILRSNRMVPKLCRELPLIKLMMPPKGILMIHSYGEAREHFVYKGISGGPTQLVAINSYGTVLLCSVVSRNAPWN